MAQRSTERIAEVNRSTSETERRLEAPTRGYFGEYGEKVYGGTEEVKQSGHET